MNVKNNYSLLINDLEGSLLNNENLKMKISGLENSLRKKEDGVAFFGYESNSESSTLLSDYNMNKEKISEFPYKLPNPIFAIYFDQLEGEYYIKSCKNKQLSDNNYDNKSKNSLNIQDLSFLLLKVSKPFILKRKELLVIGGGILIEVDVHGKDLYITRLPFGKNNTKESFSFTADSNSLITIGRGKDCTIKIDDNSLSKVNLTFKFSKMTIETMHTIDAVNKKRTIEKFIESGYKNTTIVRFWEVYDGSTSKASTNGIWLFLTHSYIIYDGVVLKLGKNKIQIKKEISSID